MQLLRRLRRSDSNSRPNVRPAAGVPEHRVSINSLNEGVKNVTDSGAWKRLGKVVHATHGLRDAIGNEDAPKFGGAKGKLRYLRDGGGEQHSS